MEKIKKESSLYTKFSLLFGALGLLVFLAFIIRGTSFVQGGDGIRQHIIAMMYYGEFLRSLLAGKLTMWSFNIGEGSDVIQILNFYAMGDPFTLLCAFFPKGMMHICFTMISILKIYCAGLSFIYLCSYTKVKSRTGIIIGTLAYCFSYYALGVNHPFFLNSLIYFPLMVVGVKKIVDEGKFLLFVFAVMICALSNFYFFYIIALFTALYVLMELIGKYGRDYKSILRKILVIFCYALLGVALAAFLFIPVIYFFITDSRAQLHPVLLFYPMRFYLKVPVFFFIPREENGLFMGYSCVVYMAIVSLFIKRKSKLLRNAIIVCVALIIVPFFDQLINGMNHAEQRWCWVLVLVSSYILAVQWDDLKEFKSRTVFMNMCAVIAYAVALHIIYPRRFYITIFQMSLFILLWLAYARFPQRKERTFVFIAVISLIGNANYIFLNIDDMNNEVKQVLDNGISRIKEVDNTGFYRFVDDSTMPNLNVVCGISSPASYWSLTSGNSRVYREMVCSTKNKEAHFFTDYDSRAVLEALSRVKYYVTEQKRRIPYCFVPTEINGVYKSPNALPLGYTYDRYVPMSDFYNMSVSQRQQALLKGVVLDGDYDISKVGSIAFDDKNIPYEVKCSEGALFRPGAIVIDKKNATVKLKYKGLPDSETYLCLENFRYSSEDHIYDFDLKRTLKVAFSAKGLTQNPYMEFYNMDIVRTDGCAWSISNALFTAIMMMFGIFSTISDILKTERRSFR